MSSSIPQALTARIYLNQEQGSGRYGTFSGATRIRFIFKTKSSIEILLDILDALAQLINRSC